MHHPRSRLVPLVAALVALVALVAVPAASAKRTGAHGKAKADRNHDRIPDRWERRFKLSLRVDQSRRDQDRDGLRNRAEFLARTDPREADSDDDGVRDGAEHTGRVVSFDGDKLVVRLFGGDEVSAHVTARTEVRCHPARELEDEAAQDAATARAASDGAGGQPGDDQSGDQPSEDGARGGAEGDQAGEDDGQAGEDDGQAGDEHGDRGRREHGHACAASALTPGAVVHEAKLVLTADGLVWREVQLVGSPA